MATATKVRKLDPKWALSRASHAEARKKLKAKGLCVWRCGSRVNKKISISLCPGCFKLQRERRVAAQKVAKKGAR